MAPCGEITKTGETGLVPLAGGLRAAQDLVHGTGTGPGPCFDFLMTVLNFGYPCQPMLTKCDNVLDVETTYYGGEPMNRKTRLAVAALVTAFAAAIGGIASADDAMVEQARPTGCC